MAPSSQIDQSLAAVLRAQRLDDGRSQESLAHDVGLTVAALARIERGEANPTWSTVRRIAGGLQLSMQSLGQLVDEHDTNGS